MAGLKLHIVSPIIRNTILSMKINSNYDSGETPIQYSFNTPIDEEPRLTEYRPEILEYTKGETFDRLQKLDKAARFELTDGYSGYIRRNESYWRQWDRPRSSTVESERTPDIYSQIDKPSDDLRILRGETENSPYRLRSQFDNYISYTNRIFGKNTPTSIGDPSNRSSSPTNVMAAIVRGDGVGLAINPYENGVRVVTDFDIQQTLAGRIFSQASGMETPLGHFGLRAAAVSMANQMMAKTGRFVSGAIQETSRWIVNNTVGRLFGGEGSEFDLNAFGASRITNPPGVMDDILNATGLNRGLNMAAGGLGLDFLLQGNNWSQTATTGNDGKYVQLDNDLLADTTSNSGPDFEMFLDPKGMSGRQYADGKEKNLFQRIFAGKEGRKREVVNEWEYRRLQQDNLLDWTGAMNARMIFALLEMNKYSPGYTKKSARRENRRGIELENKGYTMLFPNNPYLNHKGNLGLPTVAEESFDIDNKLNNFVLVDDIAYKYNTITWGESNKNNEGIDAELDVVEPDGKTRRQKRRDRRDNRKRDRDNRKRERDDERAQERTEKQMWKDYRKRTTRKERREDGMRNIGAFREDYRNRLHFNPDAETDDSPTKTAIPLLIRDLGETDTLMGKTAALFAMNKIGTMVSRFHKSEEKPSFIQTGVHPVFGMSKGRPLANKNGYIRTTEEVYTDPWCRVWTAETQHRTVLNAIRPFLTFDNNDPGNVGCVMTMEEIHGTMDFIRPFYKQFAKYTSLQNNGLPKIAPYRGDFDGTYNDKWEGEKKDRYKYNRKYMFSIENLAWKGLELENLLCKSQIGPNGGRIYWFSPLNLKFDEKSTARVEGVSFIGRGEPLYSFRGNTTREGQLSFSMIVDHSSFHEFMEGRTAKNNNSVEEEFRQSVLRFDAGCEFPFERKESKGCVQIMTQDTISTMVDIVPPVNRDIEPPKTIDLVTVYFPNDFSGVNWHVYTNETPDIKALVQLANSGGKKTMDYLYVGGGSLPSGEDPAGIDGSVYGNGYEMGRVGTDALRRTLSNVEIPVNDGGTYTMREWREFSGGKSAKGLSYKHKHGVDSFTVAPKNWQNKDYNLTNLISDFITNMHVTDKIEFYDKKGGTKLTPSTKTTVLPRIRYGNCMTNWDIGNFQLNATKSQKDRLSFGAFYEICIGQGQAVHTSPAHDNSEIEEDYKTKENLIKLFNSAETIQILGNASKDGTASDNKKLGRYRAVSLALFIIETLGVGEGGLNIHGEGAPVWEIKDEVLTDQATNELGIASSENSKKFRHAHVIIKTKQTGGEELHPKQTQTTVDTETNVSEYTLSRKGRYDEEMDFYEYVGDMSETATDVTWTNFRDRYNKYIPALWSCTPEGFNGRLTFLHQCLRSGPTNVRGENSGGVNNISNLAFGRPPVCILKIGDFIQSKVFIDNISFNYDKEGIKWDLNPEGIGIQPMYVDVTLNIKYMGGQDITGAIARLQNAVSFNYYANTSVYDDRADGNTIDDKGDIVPDMSRKRGLHYENGKRTTTKTRQLETMSMYGGSTQNDIGEEEINNLNGGGLFNVFTYKNGEADCPSDTNLDSIKLDSTTEEHEVLPNRRILPQEDLITHPVFTPEFNFSLSNPSPEQNPNDNH